MNLTKKYKGDMMDTIDYKIIELLQTNGRISMKELGELVSLSSPAVSERVKRLEIDGIITGYTATINPEKLGLTIHAIINVSMLKNSRKDFFELLEKCENIIECHHVTGRYSMTMTCMFRHVSELESLVYEIQQFGNTNTLIILSSPLKRRIIL